MEAEAIQNYCKFKKMFLIENNVIPIDLEILASELQKSKINNKAWLVMWASLISDISGVKIEGMFIFKELIIETISDTTGQIYDCRLLRKISFYSPSQKKEKVIKFCLQKCMSM